MHTSENFDISPGGVIYMLVSKAKPTMASKLLSVMLTLLFALASALQPKAVDEFKGFKRLELPFAVGGPESLAFDLSGGGPYTGVSDGRILKWQGNAWGDFSVTSAKREERCDGSQSSSLESLCGRPLGLQFSKTTGNLYIADAYYGLVVVGPKGGVATPLATEADGKPFRFTNGLDMDQETGMVYFTDSSSRFQRWDYMSILTTGDTTGRLMKYDPHSKNVTVLLTGLAFPNGVALSEDKSFILVTETTTCRVLTYWLKGAKSGTTDVFAELPGNPDNIKKNSRGEFWAPINQITNQYCSRSEWSLEVVSFGNQPNHSIALRLSKEGIVLEVLNQPFLEYSSEVSEINGTLWIGSVIVPYVGVYKL